MEATLLNESVEHDVAIEAEVMTRLWLLPGPLLLSCSALGEIEGQRMVVRPRYLQRHTSTRSRGSDRT